MARIIIKKNNYDKWWINQQNEAVSPNASQCLVREWKE